MFMNFLKRGGYCSRQEKIRVNVIVVAMFGGAHAQQWGRCHRYTAM